MTNLTSPFRNIIWAKAVITMTQVFHVTTITTPHFVIKTTPIYKQTTQSSTITSYEVLFNIIIGLITMVWPNFPQFMRNNCCLSWFKLHLLYLSFPPSVGTKYPDWRILLKISCHSGNFFHQGSTIGNNSDYQSIMSSGLGTWCKN